MVPASMSQEFESTRLSGMRIRLVALAIFNLIVWSSHALLYEEFIFPDLAFATPYRLAQLVHCVGLLWLASRRKWEIRAVERGAVFLIAGLMPIHGLAMLVVRDEVVVPFLLTMEWSQPVVALAMLMSFSSARVLFGVTWSVGVAVVLSRPGFDADLSDHAVLALVYAVVAVSIRNHDQLRTREFLTRRELADANQELRRADEARSRFFTNLSHDLRTPLALIRGATHALGQAVTHGEIAQRIDGHVTDIADLADQLVEAAKLDARRIFPQPVALDVRAFVAKLQARFAGGPEGGRVVLAEPVSAPASPLVVSCDVAHFTRIVTNLLSNATRQFARGASQVELRVWSEEDAVVVDVINDGPPIDAGVRAQLFERFASFDCVGSVQSGIGLSIARELAELNAGSLELVDAAQTTFRLRLPATSDPPVALPEPSARAFPVAPATLVAPNALLASNALLAPNALLALVVEDHTELRGLLTELLSKKFRVIATSTLAAAERALEETLPAVVLADVMLPDGRGDSLITTVRQRAPSAQPPVVLVSAASDEAMRVAALEAGAADFIVKPFGPDELLARVDSACERAQERQRALEDQRQEFLGELHDGVNSALARAILLLDAAQLPSTAPARRAEILERARAAATEALEEARALMVARCEEWVPWSRTALDVDQILRETAGRGARPLTLLESTDGTVPMLTAAQHHAITRLAAEAALNAIRHGDAAIEGSLIAHAGAVRFELSNPVAARHLNSGTRFGLRAATRRLTRLGGRLHSGAANGSFRIEATLPTQSPASALRVLVP